MGIKKLRKVQLGAESSAGTAVAATAMWRGVGTLQDNRQTVFANEDVGILTGADRTYVPMYEGALAMEATDATFEQLPYVLEAGVKTIATGVSDTGSGFIYNYTFPTTAVNTIKTYTIETGDDIQAEEMEYSHVKDFTLSGRSGEAWTIESNWVGRQISTCTFTSLTPTATEAILFGKSALYIEAASAAYGTTIKASTLLEASLAVTTGWVPVYTANGQLYFDFIKNVGPEILLTVTYEHNAIAVAEIAAWRAGTKRSIQIKVLGSTLTSGGTYTTKQMHINVSGKYESVEKLGELNGNDIVRATLRARYDLTESRIGNILIVNELATIP